MRTLLRHTETGLYLQGPGKSTSSPEIALDFRFVDRARQFIRTWELEKVAIVFAFEDSQVISSMTLETDQLEEQLNAAALG
jgi:hypothetical protein